MQRIPFTPDAVPNFSALIDLINAVAGLYASCLLHSGALVAAQPDRNRAIVFEHGIADLCECGAPVLTQCFQL